MVGDGYAWGLSLEGFVFLLGEVKKGWEFGVVGILGVVIDAVLPFVTVNNWGCFPQPITERDLFFKRICVSNT